MLPETILTVLLSLPSWHGDAGLSPDERELLLAPVASALAAASDEPALLAGVIAHGFWETRYASPVLAGRCDLMPVRESCDQGRARGAFQLWRVACAAAYEHPAGSLASLRQEARCAVRLLDAGRRRCRSWEGAFAAMRGGAACSMRTAARREKTRQVVLLGL